MALAKALSHGNDAALTRDISARRVMCVPFSSEHHVRPIRPAGSALRAPGQRPDTTSVRQTDPLGRQLCWPSQGLGPDPMGVGLPTARRAGSGPTGPEDGASGASDPRGRRPLWGLGRWCARRIGQACHVCAFFVRAALIGSAAYVATQETTWAVPRCTSASSVEAGWIGTSMLPKIIS
jgi:hypothetical protein